MFFVRRSGKSVLPLICCAKTIDVSLCDQTDPIAVELDSLYEEKKHLLLKKKNIDKELREISARQRQLEAILTKKSNSSQSYHRLLNRGFSNSKLWREEKTITLSSQTYKIGKQIGRGTCGTVQIGFDEKNDDKIAVKRCALSETESITDLKREICVLRRIDELGGQENLLLFKGVQSDDKFLYVGTEYVDGGDLFDVIVKNGTFSQSEAASLIMQLAKALLFLHSNEIIHGDLKPENILISKQKNIVKLADFGSASMAGLPPEQNFNARTTAYCPPELLLGGNCTEAADMWAIGCILYIMLCGKHPFDLTGRGTKGQIEANIVTNDVSFSSSSKIPPKAQELIRALMARDAKNRLSVQKLIDHPWLKDQS